MSRAFLNSPLGLLPFPDIDGKIAPFLILVLFPFLMKPEDSHLSIITSSSWDFVQSIS